MDAANSDGASLLQANSRRYPAHPMKTRFFIICLIIAAICLFLFFQRASKLGTESATNSESTTRDEQINLKPTNGLMTNLLTVTPTNAVAPGVNPTQSVVTNAVNARLKALWNASIDFYGKVVDENNAPVEDAKISFSWTVLTTSTGTEEASTTSDQVGLFSLHNKTGHSLLVTVSKDGYYALQKGQSSFDYSMANENFSPDPQNPVLFHLRKKEKGEALITKDFPNGFGQIWQLHHDGTPIELNLLNGNRVSSGTGQLKLELWRDLSDRNAQKFNWKLQLTVPGGGLIGTDQEFAFEAPDSGYQSSIVIDMPATNQNWQSEVRSKYYFQLPNGNYGRIDFYLLPYNGVFTVHSVINPSGSRNLEPAQ